MTPAASGAGVSLADTAISSEQAARVLPLFKALAHPARLRMLSLILSSETGEAGVFELNGAFDVTKAVVSHHLKIFHSAGFVDRDKRGSWVYYRGRPETLDIVATLVTPVGAALSDDQRALAQEPGPGAAYPQQVPAVPI